MTHRRDSLLTSSEVENIFSGAPSFSRRNRAARAVWMITWVLLARWTPPPLHRWRIILLRIFGAKVHSSCRVYSSAKIWYPPNLEMREQAILGPHVQCYNQGKIRIDERAVVSQGAFLCTGTHDIRDPSFQLVVRPIHIGENAWIAADAFVGPGVTCGEGAVLSARGAAFNDLDAGAVYRGNPAVKIKMRKT